MSSRRSLNTSIKSVGSNYNPELVYQMERMQGLLEQYDRQNKFLNRQVRQLLQSKSKVQGVVASNDWLTINKKVNMIDISTKYQRNNHESGHVESSGSKNIFTESVGSTNKPKSISRDSRYSYYQQVEQNAKINYPMNQIIKPFRHTAEISRKSLNSQLNYKIKRDGSPDKISRIVVDKKLERISESQELTNEVENKKIQREELTTTVNVLPMIKRGVYTGSPDIRSSFPSSHDHSPTKARDNSPSRVSVKSNKSGIQVTISQKSKNTTNINQQDIRFPQQQKIDQKIKPVEKVVPKEKNHKKQIPPKETKLQIQHKQQKQIESSKKKVFVVSGHFSLQTPPSKQIMPQQQNRTQLITLSCQQSPFSLQNPIGVSTSLFRNRSVSQHKISPSEKINCDQQPLNRCQSRTDIRNANRGKSIQNRKKFINVVSSKRFHDKAQN